MRNSVQKSYLSVIYVSLSNIALAVDISQLNTEKFLVITFTEVRVIEGAEVAAQEDHTVIIRDGQITQMARNGSITIPKDAKMISLKIKNLFLGGVMMHEYLFSVG